MGSTKNEDEERVSGSLEHYEEVVEHHSNVKHLTQPVPTEHVQSSQELSSFKRSPKAPTEATKPITEESGLSLEPDYQPSNNSFLQTSLGEINPSSPELSQMPSGVANNVSMDTGFDQVEGNVSVKVQCQSHTVDIQHLYKLLPLF